MEQLSPEQTRAQFLDAVQHEQAGRLGEAEKILQTLLEINPSQLPSLCLMGRVQRRLQQYAEASRYLNAAQAMAPSAPPVVYELARLATDQNDLRAAAGYLKHLTQLKPLQGDNWFDLGYVLEMSGKWSSAIDAFRRALQLGDSNNEETYTHLGSVLAQDGQEAAAKENYLKALELNPDHAPAMYGLGMVITAFGEFEEASQWLRRAVRRDPNLVEVYQQLAAVRKFESADDPDIELMSKLLTDPARDDLSREKLHFAIGKTLDDCGEYERAFEHIAEANRLKRSRKAEFDLESHQALVGSIISTFDREFFDHFSPRGSQSKQPVFIVGMPRSGTSLVEQILASHPRVNGAGELPFIEQASRTRVGLYPDLISTLDAATLEAIANDYLRHLTDRGGNVRHITDKYPANFLHIGFIRLLFPQARIIHCRRNPVDTCLSIYFQDFATANLYANSLEDISDYFQCYQRLMEHWEGLGSDRLLTVDYENLTADLEGQVRPMIDWLGLEWDPACLDYTSNRRAVSTLSRWQVRQPVYRSSVGRWRRYENHLGAFG
ncbi:MAG: sulfotransferase [Gammaproteobacteria bacterium]|nr:sulfotransferase [Gammaproteobacteria bacterium]